MSRGAALILERLRRALTRNRVRTGPDHPDPSLRGRAYAVPYDEVWSRALEIVDGRWGWRLVDADDLEGVIRAEAKTPVFRFTDDVEIQIGLDDDGQTRVDAASASRVGKADMGTNARRVRRFFRHLDRAVN